MLAGMLAAVRGPSTWPPQDAPVTLDERLHALVDEHVADSDEGRRTALRHQLARRLLDDPVVYVDTLDAETRAYFVNQRGAMAARLCEATGLVAEQRAEGLALIDEAGSLTDVAMPAEGTEAHVTLLVAEFLAERARRQDGVPAAAHRCRRTTIADFLRGAKERYGRYWRKSAREPGARTRTGADRARAAGKAAADRARCRTRVRAAAGARPLCARRGRNPQPTAPRSRQSSGSLF